LKTSKRNVNPDNLAQCPQHPRLHVIDDGHML
jgi:hypothetical protein